MYIWRACVSGRKAYLLVGVLFALTVVRVPPVGAIPQVVNRYDQISDSTVSSVATHLFGFTYTDLTNPVGSVSFEFCSNSPLTSVPCTVPSGLDVSAAVLSAQSGQTGFVINGVASTANRLVISRAAQAPTGPAAASTYQFNNITNPDAEGSYYVRIQTYTSTTGTGPALEDGGLVFAILGAFDVSAEVPPYLRFCASVTITGVDCLTATSFFIDLGEFSKTSPTVASSEMVIATNAPSGYTISVAGTTLTSGNNIIPALAVPSTSQPGTSQFGLNLRANNSPGIGADPSGPGTGSVAPQYGTSNVFKFAPGDAVATSTTTSDNRKFTVSYLTNVAPSQPGGVYATTISFIALANF